MKKMNIILVGILIFAVLSSVVFANIWVSPTDYIDVGAAWTNEPNTYDEYTGTYADTLKTGIDNALALTIPSALPCDRIRVFVADYKSGSFNPDILIRIKEDDETVTTIYDGVMNWGEWVEIEFSPKSIDVIYISANTLGGGHRLRVYEADFGDPSPSYGKVGAECNFDGDVGVPSGSAYYINEVLLSIDDITTTDLIIEGDLKCVNDAVDEDIFTYESTTGDFEWHTPAELNLVKTTMESDVDLNEHNILLEASLSSDHTYSGLIDSQLVGETVVFGQLLYFNWTDKEWKLTDADAEATVPGLRIALEDKVDGQTCKMLVVGYIRDDSAFDFAGSMVYASCTTGAVSSTAPSASGDQLQRVGVAKSADILFFYPSADVGEI